MEAEDPAVVDDAVDDRGGHVPVAEHVAPSAGLEVRGGDDAAGLVAVRAGLEQEPGPIDLSSASNLLSSLAFLKRMTRLEAVKNLTGIMRWHASMPIAMARWVLPQPTSPWSTSSSARSTNSGLSSCSRPRSAGNEAMPPVVAVKRLVPGEPGLSGQPPPFGSGPARVLLPEQVGQEAEPAGRGVLQVFVFN